MVWDEADIVFAILVDSAVPEVREPEGVLHAAADSVC